MLRAADTHLDMIERIQKDVGGLEVAMEQMLFVAVGERGGKLPEVPTDCSLGQPPLLVATPLYERSQITTRGPFHFDTEHVAADVRLPVRDDSRVLQPLQN